MHKTSTNDIYQITKYVIWIVIWTVIEWSFMLVQQLIRKLLVLLILKK